MELEGVEYEEMLTKNTEHNKNTSNIKKNKQKIIVHD